MAYDLLSTCDNIRIYTLTSSRVLPPPDAVFGCSLTRLPRAADVSLLANVMFAFSWRPKISGVSLIGRLFTYSMYPYTRKLLSYKVILRRKKENLFHKIGVVLIWYSLYYLTLFLTRTVSACQRVRPVSSKLNDHRLSTQWAILSLLSPL